MDEADNLLLESLRQIGVTIKSLQDFDAESFIKTIIICFERISSMLAEEDNFVDVKFLKKQNLKEATNRYKIC